MVCLCIRKTGGEMKYKEIVVIDGKRYQVCENDFIGKGGYGTVWKVERLSDKKLFALKVCNKYYPDHEIEFPEETIAQIKKKAKDEIHFLNLVSDPAMYHIMPLVAVGSYDGLPAMVMPLADHSLAAVYNARRKGENPYGIDDFLRWIRQILIALDKIHSLSNGGSDGGEYVHRDIKFSNVLIMDGDAYIADFGGIKKIDSDDTTSFLHVPAWSAPEMLIPKRFVKTNTDPRKPAPRYDITPKADMFCFGSMLYAILTGRTLKCQNELKELVPAPGNPAPRTTRYFGKIGGIEHDETLRLRAAFLKLVFPDRREDDTEALKDVETPARTREPRQRDHGTGQKLGP